MKWKKLAGMVMGALMLGLGGMTTSAALPTIPTYSPEKEKAVVYFTRDISSQGLVKVYDALHFNAEGKTGIKISTGEPPKSNYLRPELLKGIVDKTHGTIVEDNTAYGGARSESASHWNVIKDHGFLDKAPVDILDEEGSMALPVKNGRWLKENLVGSHFKNYDSYVVVSHFKGHAMAGFGGALKNISIGFGSAEGKALIHSGGRYHSLKGVNFMELPQNPFLESMAEADESVMNARKGNIAFVNVLNRLSVDCNCDGNPAEPDIHDIGILASTDPVAIDQASLDLIAGAPGSRELVKRIFMRDGTHTVEAAKDLGVGTKDYVLIDIDKAAERGK